MMKRLSGMILSLLLLSGCQPVPSAEPASTPLSEPTAASTPASGTYQKITPEEAKALIDAGSVTVVDVRTESEYQEGHIKGAIVVPNETIADAMPEALPDLEATLLVYCRSGRRSKEASEKLLSIGYRHVYDLGGIIDWPYETVTD